MFKKFLADWFGFCYEVEDGLYIGGGIVVASKEYEIHHMLSKNHVSQFDDGYLNTLMMNSTNSSGSAKYVMSIGEDWYIPSKKEMKYVCSSYLKRKWPEKYHLENDLYWSSNGFGRFGVTVSSVFGTYYPDLKIIRHFIRPIKRIR